METKRLYRSQSDRMVAGVAGGIASYLGVDPIFVRLGFLLLGLLNGVGALLYIALWLLVPAEGSITADARERLAQRIRNMFAAPSN
jgi:phage shock protein C